MTPDKVATLRVERMPLADLKPHPRNPRKHPGLDSPQWAALQTSLSHDYFDPLVWNLRNGMLVSGHLRHKVLLATGFTHADVSVVDYDEPTHYARLIAANSLLGEWEETILASLARDLESGGLAAGLAGLDPKAMAALLDGPEVTDDTATAAVLVSQAEEIQRERNVQLGDLYALGEHRVLCGDCTAAANWQRLLGDRRADMVWLALDSEPTPPTAPSPSFTLDVEAPRIIGGKTIYPEMLATYAALYDCSTRKLKRMIEKGRWLDLAHTQPREPADLPPFHRPAEMPEWWDRRMENRCPPGILKAAAKAKPKTPPAPAQAPQSIPSIPSIPSTLPTEPPSAPAVQRDFSDIRTLDIAANVEQLRRSLAIVTEQLEEARRGTVIDGKLVIDDGVITARNRDYRDTFSEMRKAENDLLAWQQTMGELARRDDVRAENNRIAAAIYRAVCRLVKTVRPQIAGKPEPEQDSIWNTEVLACFACLKTAEFTTFEPKAA